MIQRKKLLITRHGECPKAPDGVNSLDSLLPDSFREEYRVGIPLRDFVDQEGITPRETLFRHSGKKRTQYTGETILAGAFNMQQPTNPSELRLPRKELISQGLDTQPLSVLDYEDILFSLEGFRTDGENGYMNKWIANPEATHYDNGEPITPFQECLERKSQGFAEILKEFMSGDKRLGVIATHACTIDAMVVGALNSVSSYPIKSTEEYGGSFKQGEFATIDLSNIMEGPYKAILERGTNADRINLDVFLSHPGYTPGEWVQSQIDLPVGKK